MEDTIIMDLTIMGVVDMEVVAMAAVVMGAVAMEAVATAKVIMTEEVVAIIAAEAGTQDVPLDRIDHIDQKVSSLLQQSVLARVLPILDGDLFSILGGDHFFMQRENAPSRYAHV